MKRTRAALKAAHTGVRFFLSIYPYLVLRCHSSLALFGRGWSADGAELLLDARFEELHQVAVVAASEEALLRRVRRQAIQRLVGEPLSGLCRFLGVRGLFRGVRRGRERRGRGLDRVRGRVLRAVDAGAQSDVCGLQRGDLRLECRDLCLEPLDLDSGACAGCCLCRDLLALHSLDVLDRQREFRLSAIHDHLVDAGRVGANLDRETEHLVGVGVVGDAVRQVVAVLVRQFDVAEVQLVQLDAGQPDTLRDVLLRVGHDDGRRERSDLPLRSWSGGCGRAGRGRGASARCGRVRHDRCRRLRDRHGGDREDDEQGEQYGALHVNLQWTDSARASASGDGTGGR